VTTDGPRVLLVQPGFSQRRKQHDDAQKNLAFSRDLTHRAAAEAGPVDLLCWGESMLYIPIFTPAAEAAVRAGTARAPAWSEPVTVEDVEACQALERHWVEREVLALGARPPGPMAGASFSVGAEVYDLVAGELRRRVALVVYDAAGGRSLPAYKRRLVPLGETFFGLERWSWVRSLAREAAGYLPDLLPGQETGLLPLRGRDGRSWRASGTLCFDNAHPQPYVDGLCAGPVDFHLVASNEAWYETSCEMDQMVAFTRVFALMTARAFVRATNSGVSLVIGPDGRELGRVRDARGVDRAVAGSLAVTVPVPLPGAATTPYVRWSGVLEGAWIALLAFGLALRGPRPAPG
jgi:apolipoprotein N-acyltransferase